MATSGSINFAATRDDIITEALEQVGALGEGESPSAAQLTSCGRTLNYMLKSWQASETNLFAIQKLYVFLQADQVKYELSSTSSDHFSASIVNTAIATAASSGASTIEVDSITGISASDNIGVELDDGTVQWTTVNGAPSGSTVTLTATLTDDVAVDNRVYVYTTIGNRPMRILEAVRTDAESGNEIPLKVLPLRTYTEFTDKTSEGTPTNLYFEPQRITSYIHVWPEPDKVDMYVTLWVQRTLDDLDAASDDVDYPQEWYLAIALNLAILLSTKYGISSTEFRKLQWNAMAAKEEAESWDTENGFSIEPETESNRG